MKGKHLYQVLIVTLMLFSLPQYIVSQPEKFAVTFPKTFLNPEKVSTSILRDVNARTIANKVFRSRIEAGRSVLVQTSGIKSINGERDSRNIEDIALPGKDHRIKVFVRPHPIHDPRLSGNLLNSPHPTSVWTIPLLGTLASSFKANPSLCGNWYVLESDYPYLESELIDFNHTSINEYISISENGVSFFSCGQAILSTDVLADYINSLHNETSEITWLDKNAIFIDVHFGNCSKELILRRVTKEMPSRIGRTIGKSSSPHIIALPQRDVEADSQSRFSHHVKIDASSEDSNVELLTNKWWIDYIGKIIEEQQIKQGIEQMQEQLFEKGMKFDFEYEWKDGEVGFIIFTYGYKLDAA